MSGSRLERYVLLGTLAVAAMLRGWAVTERGLFTDDEGFYAGGVKTYSAVFAYLRDYLTGGGQEGLVAYFTQHGGNPILSDKPTFIVLGFLASLVLGVHDYTLIAVSALFGVLTVFCVYQVGKLVSGRAEVGLAGALLLAVSPLHVAYSRSAFADVTAAAVAWLATGIYLRFWTDPHRYRRYLPGSALLVGLVFTIHPRLLWLPLPFLFLELWRSWRGAALGSAKRRFKAVFMFAWLAAVPTVLWEVTTRGMQFLVFSNPSWSTALARGTGQGQFETFLEYTGLRAIIDVSAPVMPVVNPPSPEYTYYFTLLGAHEGWVIFGLAMAGAAFAGLKWFKGARPPQVLLVALLLLIPLTLNSLLFYYPQHAAPRFLLIAMPTFVLLVALALVEVVQGTMRTWTPKVQTVAAATLTVAVALWQAPYLAEVLKIRSAYPRVVDYIAQRGGTKHITDSMLVARVYVGRQNAIDHYVSLRVSDSDRGYRHISLPKLQDAYARGYRYFVRTPGHFYANELVRLTGGSYLLPETACRHPVQPRYELFHPQGSYWPAEIRHSERDAHVPHYLRVYLLQDLIQRLERDPLAYCD